VDTTPFFKDATPTAKWVMRLFVGANIAVILFCATYLLRHFAASGLGCPSMLATALAGYFLADFSSGMIHWGMDTWFDERTSPLTRTLLTRISTSPRKRAGRGSRELRRLPIALDVYIQHQMRRA
jgi:ubiquitin-conjugating enzyme E2 variant